MSGGPPTGAQTWHVRIDIGENDGETHATAHLETGAGTHLTGHGQARLNPADTDVPEIGEELAAARALSQLAHVLLETAAADIGEVLHTRVRLDE